MTARHVPGGTMTARPSSSGSLQELLLALHECVTVREIQDVYIGHVDGVLRARGHGIYYLDDRRRPALVRTSGVTDAFLERYEEVGRGIDPLFGHVRERLEPIASSAWRPRDWRRHPFYEVIAAGGLHHILQAPLTVEDELVGTLNLARVPNDRPFVAGDCARAALVARHVSVALRRAAVFEELERRRTLVEQALDLLRVPLVATGLDGRVLFANRAAAELLDAYGPAPGSVAFLRALRRNRDTLLHGGKRVVATAVDEEPPPDGAALGVRARRRPGTRLAIRSTLVGAADAIVSFVHETPALAPVRPAVLSAREQEIVELVVRGLSNREIAELTSISRNTVKQHLKRVFGKVQVGSRTELAAAVVRSQSPEAPFRDGGQEYPPG
jgi:DNA-binding CsgD family transcriptional regulator/PAS domain-containing protein